MDTSVSAASPPPSQNPTPPRSRTSSTSSPSKNRPSNLSLDLSDVPPLIEPSPPSNTLLVTNLNDPTVFLPQTLTHLHSLISQSIPPSSPSSEEEPGILHTISPLPSLRRIILTFTSTSSAVAIRSLLDGESLRKYLSVSNSINSSASTDTSTHTHDDRIRVFFGAPTPLSALTAANRHLYPPKLDKQFFISPPPSPPAGWESREEDPPNKEVHAEDLASALDSIDSTSPVARSSSPEALDAAEEAKMDVDDPQPKGIDVFPSRSTSASVSAPSRQRTGSITRVVYRPEDQGLSPDLPAISVEDTSPDEEDGVNAENEEISPVDMSGAGASKIMAHTARPPVELMS